MIAICLFCLVKRQKKDIKICLLIISINKNDENVFHKILNRFHNINTCAVTHLNNLLKFLLTCIFL